MKLEQNRKVQEEADKQAGILTLQQLLVLDLTENHVRGQVAAGNWQREGLGVYRIGSGPIRWTQRIWVACLESGGVASHRTAGQLHGLDGVGRNFRKLDVMVTFENKRTASKTKVKRSRNLVESHIWLGAGAPRTNLARTLIDLAGVLDEEDLALALDSGIRQQDDLRLWIRRVIGKMPGRGLKGRATLLKLIDENATVVDSALEVKLRRMLKKAGLPQPIAQYPVFDGGEFLTRVDFAWPYNEPAVALLGHGKMFHHDTEQWNLDNATVRRMNALGWRLVPCSYEDVMERSDELIRDIKRDLEGYIQKPPPRVEVYE